MPTKEEIEASARRLGMSQKMVDIQKFPMPSYQASNTAAGNIVDTAEPPQNYGVNEIYEEKSSPNDVDTWLQNSPQSKASSPDDVDAWLSKRNGDSSSLPYSLQSANELNPAVESRVIKLQSKTGLPDDYIRQNVDLLEKEVATNEFNADEYRKKSPRMAAWLAENPSHAAAARNDYEKLSYIERQMKYIQSRWTVGNKQQEIKDVISPMFTRDLTKEEIKKLNELDASLSDEDYGITGFVEQVPGTTAEMLPIYVTAVKESPKYIAASAAGGAIGAGLAAGPAGALAGAGTGAYIGFNIASAVEGGKLEAALALNDLRKIKDANGMPLSKSTMLGAAAVVGVVNGTIEVIPASTLAKRLPILRNFSRQGMKQLLQNRTTRKVMIDYLKAIGENMAAEGGTEFMQEYVQMAATSAVSDQKLFTEENFLRALAAGRGGMQGGAGMSAATGALSVPGDLKKARDAKQTAKAFTDLGNAVKDTELNQTLPEKMQEIMERLSKDGGQESIYIPVQSWAQHWESQGADPKAVAREILGDEAVYEEAIETGKDLEIRTDVYAAKIAPTEHNEFFAQELRTSAESINAREAVELEKKMEEQAKAASEDKVSEVDPLDEIKDIVTEQLVAAGYNRSAARLNAEEMASRYRARAKILGVDPVGLFKQEAPKIQKLEDVGTTAELSFNQVSTETPEFKKWFSGSKIVDDGGRPITLYHGTTRDFSTFDRSSLSPESDLGAGFYFTNSADDVAINYAGEGPDLSTKIEIRAEQIASENDWEYNDPRAKEMARSELSENLGATMPVYVKIENPFVIGGGQNETLLTYESVIDDDGNFVEEKGTLLDFIEAIDRTSSEYHDGSTEKLKGSLFEAALDENGITASNLYDLVSKDESFGYFTDENGRLVSKEIFRRALEEIGFDGIIDNTVNEKFGELRKTGKSMGGVGYGAAHYVAFRPDQIKSAIGNQGSFDTNNPNILYQREGSLAPPFYSKLTQTVEQKMGGSATPEQIQGMLKEIKPEEKKWLGLDDFLKGKKKVSKQELLDHLRGNALEVKEVTKSNEAAPDIESGTYGSDGEYYSIVNQVGSDGESIGDPLANNGPFETEEEAQQDADQEAERFRTALGAGPGGGATKFGQYTLPGGENYREVLFTLPDNGPPALSEDQVIRLDDLQHMLDTSTGSPEDVFTKNELREYNELTEKKFQKKSGSFRSSHFDETNVIAHTRLNDRVDADGKRVLFVEEIQSDALQETRKIRNAIKERVKSDFQAIVSSMEKAGILEVNCD